MNDRMLFKMEVYQSESTNEIIVRSDGKVDSEEQSLRVIKALQNELSTITDFHLKARKVDCNIMTRSTKASVTDKDNHEIRMDEEEDRYKFF